MEEKAKPKKKKGGGRELNVVPSEKQGEALTVLFDDFTDALLYGGAAGGGKGSPISGLVYTNFGPKLMRDIRIGDSVSNPDGTVATVIKVHPLGEQDLYKFTFDDGSSTRVTLDHLWKVRQPRIRRFRKKPIASLPDGSEWMIRTTEQLIEEIGKGKKFCIPLTTPVEFTIPHRNALKVRPIKPYTLGALLGDGCFRNGQIKIACADREIFDGIRSEGYQGKFRETKKGLSELKLTSEVGDGIKELGLSERLANEKFIPESYKHSPISERLSLLQGLMDTDGYADSRGHASFSTVSKKLADDVCYIARSLGYKVNITSKIPTFSYKGRRKQGQLAYTVWIKGGDQTDLFTLERKYLRCANRPFNNGAGERSKRIISIEFDGREEARCITVDNPNGLYITDDFTVTHNSWLGGVWLMIMMLKYPGTRYYIGRETLKDIHTSTLLTLFKVFRHYQIPPTWYKLNSQYNFLEFRNGGKGEASRIDLLDCKRQPSDPMFERFGSMEFTSGWLEEAGEIDFQAFDVLKSRVGRCLNDVYGVKSKNLLTANPNKEWLYQFFYKRWKEGKLPHNLKFIQAFVWDNPHIESDYRRQLEDITDPVTRQRLLHGVWEYETADCLIEYDAILDLFTNPVEGGKRYLTCDVARFGSDKAVIWLWEGWQATLLEIHDLSGTDFQADRLSELSQELDIPRSRILVDEAGIGGGVIDQLRGVKGFIANAAPKKHRKLGGKENFRNLKTQCAYMFAEKANRREIRIVVPDKFPGQVKRDVIAELEQLRRKDPEKDGKLMMLPKDEVKATLGRSPDFSDSLIMRMAFDLKATSGARVIRGKGGDYGLFH